MRRLTSSLILQSQSSSARAESADTRSRCISNRPCPPPMAIVFKFPPMGPYTPRSSEWVFNMFNPITHQPGSVFIVCSFPVKRRTKRTKLREPLEESSRHWRPRYYSTCAFVDRIIISVNATWPGLLLWDPFLRVMKSMRKLWRPPGHDHAFLPRPISGQKYFAAADCTLREVFCACVWVCW